MCSCGSIRPEGPWYWPVVTVERPSSNSFVARGNCSASLSRTLGARLRWAALKMACGWGPWTARLRTNTRRRPHLAWATRRGASTFLADFKAAGFSIARTFDQGTTFEPLLHRFDALCGGSTCGAIARRRALPERMANVAPALGAACGLTAECIRPRDAAPTWEATGGCNSRGARTANLRRFTFSPWLPGSRCVRYVARRPSKSPRCILPVGTSSIRQGADRSDAKIPAC